LFNAITGIKTTHVPYRGAGPALNDLLGGHLDIIIADTPVLLPLVNTNAVRPLALFAAERSPLIPNVATAAQLGYPEIVMENWYGVLGPAGLAPSVRATLEKAILEVLASPAVKERFAAGGLQGVRDSDGFHFFRGRADDLIKISGQWVYPLEVELCLAEHPDVRECAVFAVERPDRRMTLKAVVVMNSRAFDASNATKMLQDFVKAKLLPYKYPREVKFIEELPKTGTGKIDRQALLKI